MSNRSSITSTKSAKFPVTDSWSPFASNVYGNNRLSVKVKPTQKHHKKFSIDSPSRFNIITSNHVHYDLPKKQKISYINLKIRKLYRDSELQTANVYSYVIKVECNSPDNAWVMRRNVADFKSLDHILHGGCVGIDPCRERGLPPLHPPETIDKGHNSYSQVYLQYNNYLDTLSRFLDSRSNENGNLLLLDCFVCSLLLSWFEISLDGCHKVHMPVALAQPFHLGAPSNAVVKVRYPKQALGDLTIEVSDIVTVVESLVESDSAWARGKSDKTFLSGLFPAYCVEDFNFDNTVKPDLSLCPGLQTLIKQERENKPNKNQGASNSTPGTYQHVLDSKMGLKSSLTSSGSTKKGQDGSNLPTEEPLTVPPVFGSTLSNAMKWNHALKESRKQFTLDGLNSIYVDEFCEVSLSNVPYFVQTMVHYVHNNGEVDGIYRLSGSSSEIATIVQMIDSGFHHIDFSNFDIHSTSSTLKQFFRDLSTPLIPIDNYNSFMAPFDKYPSLIQNKSNSRSDVIKSTDKESKVTEAELTQTLDELQENLYRLPFYHYHTLKLLMLHLKVFVSKSSVTSMGLYNLAIMWAPNLLFDPFEKECTDYIEIAKRAQATAAKKGKLIELLISHSSTLFNDHLPKSILQKINSLGCEDKLRGGQTSYESDQFEVITKGANHLNQTLTLPRVPGKDRMKKAIRNLFSPKTLISDRQNRDRSASLVGGRSFQINTISEPTNFTPRPHMPRDELSIESGLYASINANNNEVKNLHPNDKYDSSDFLQKTSGGNHYMFPSSDSHDKTDDESASDVSECHSDDSTIGQFVDDKLKRRKNATTATTSLTTPSQSVPSKFQNAELHIYSQIQKEGGLNSKSNSNFASTTFTVGSSSANPTWETRSEKGGRGDTSSLSFIQQFNSGGFIRGSEICDDIPFIDAVSPVSPATSGAGKDSAWSSKDSVLSSSAYQKSPLLILSSNQNQYVAQDLDNFRSDLVYEPKNRNLKLPTAGVMNLHGSCMSSNAKAPYKRYFSAGTPSSPNSGNHVFSKSRPETPAHSAGAGSNLSRTPDQPGGSPAMLRSPAVGMRPIKDSSMNNLTDKYSTNCSFDSGVENNASSNDEL